MILILDFLLLRLLLKIKFGSSNWGRDEETVVFRELYPPHGHVVVPLNEPLNLLLSPLLVLPDVPQPERLVPVRPLAQPEVVVDSDLLAGAARQTLY